MAKYLTKELVEAPFRKGERRYSMTNGIREFWLKIEHEHNLKYTFTIEPDNSDFIKASIEHVWNTIKNIPKRLSIREIFGEKDILDTRSAYRKKRIRSMPERHDRRYKQM